MLNKCANPLTARPKGMNRLDLYLPAGEVDLLAKSCAQFFGPSIITSPNRNAVVAELADAPA